MTSLLRPFGSRIEGVVVDLDDTIYPQHEWLSGACAEVARAAASAQVSAGAVLIALEEALSEGSDRGDTIDRALHAVGSSQPVGPLVEVFRAYAPARLDPYPGAAAALERLAALVPLVLVTDGNPAGQRAKLRATGLAPLFRAVVLSDELGREHRKPDAAPFERCLDVLGLPASSAVMIGDRPDKDVEGAARVGMRALRVKTGEYAGCPDHPATWAVSDSLADAARFLERHAGGDGRGGEPARSGSKEER